MVSKIKQDLMENADLLTWDAVVVLTDHNAGRFTGTDEKNKNTIQKNWFDFIS